MVKWIDFEIEHSEFFEGNGIIDEPAKKRQKSENEVATYPVCLSVSDYEDEETNDQQLDQKLDQEQTKADNLVIKDLMGTVKPESNKVIKPDLSLFFIGSLFCSE